MAAGKLSPIVGSKEAGYLFEFKADGVFLTVYPTEDDGILFELSDMRQILKEYGVLDYEIEVLARIVRETKGEPQKLADRFEAILDLTDASDSNGAALKEIAKEKVKPYKVEVSRDKMAVFIRFDRKATGIMPELDEVLSALENNNITYGIDKDAISKALEGTTDFLAAKGTAPVKGEDARIVKMFDLGEKGRPVKNEYDQVDYKNLNLFVLAKAGQRLAERIPHTAGTPGTNVFGDPLPAKPGKPKPVPAGKNTTIEEENFVVAAIDGQIVDANNKISIDPQLVIQGDVGVSTGNIDFNGCVHVGGTVQQGFVVKATGDIEINGMVSGATVDGCNVFIKGGIQGQSRGIIKASEDVRAAFVENGEIEAIGSIYINDVSLHSNLRAGKEICVEGKKGLVTGGILAAGEEVRATVLGNQMNVVTKVVVGVNPMLQRKYQETCREHTEAKRRLQQITNSLNTLGKIDLSKLPEQRAKQIKALMQSQFPLAGLVERSAAAIKQMEEEIEKMKNGRVKVSDTLYPGVRLTINSVMKIVQEEEKHCTLYVEDDFIKSGPY